MRPVLQILFAVAAVGCFNPHIQNGGFSCDPTQTPACPSGFVCVDSRCVAPSDAGGGAPSDLAGALDSGHGGAADLAGGNSCAHALCVPGAKLAPGCDPCATQICAQDNYCCVTKWSSQCVAEVTSICGRSCP